ncbi:hypothetical protein ACKI2N_032100 [Cupriavidus sp. 30B13]|uniref:hypothetical protein n=1 Tax=Cupriavidus sp. 30B13 TaxID=3384241 RepID=UPI003CF6700B
MSVKLPEKFCQMLARFDFGRLTIGPIAFCGSGDYGRELLSLNEDVHWWGAGARPKNLLMVANSDPFAILLDIDTEAVYAMDPELGWEKAVQIAADFERFVRGVGTAFLCRGRGNASDDLAQSIRLGVQGHDLGFWRNLVA